MTNEEDIEIQCYVKGDEIKGWPTIKFPKYTWGKISLSKEGITIISGWLRRAKLAIPTENIVSAKPEKYDRLSFKLDSYSVSYKKGELMKKVEILVMYYTHIDMSSKLKNYFNKFK